MSATPQSQPQDLTIAVVGATGQQGGATARRLLEHGVAVRALTRSTTSEAAQALAAAGAEVVRADLTDLASLTAAFTGTDRVFAMATMAGGGVEGEVEQGFTMAQAAKDAGVGHVVYSSVGGAERETGIPHFDSKRRIELRLAALGVPTTIVRPVYFMENLLGSVAVEDGQVVVRVPVPDGVPLQMVAVDDIAAVSVAALLDPAAVPDTIEIAGAEVTGTQIAAAFGAYAGLPARFEALPLEVLSGDLDLTAMFGWFARPQSGERAYDADFDATRAIDPTVKSLADWIPTSGWTTGR